LSQLKPHPSRNYPAVHGQGAREVVGQQPDLGAQIAEYRGKGIGRWEFFTRILPGLLGVLTPLGYAFWTYNDALAKYGPVAAESWSQPWYQLAIIALLLFSILVLIRLIIARRKVTIFKNGIRLEIFPSRKKSLRWSDISGVAIAVSQEKFPLLHVKTNHLATLYPNVGKSIRLNSSFENLPEMVSRIKAGLYPRLLPNLKTLFQKNQWLYFGPLSIQRQGIRYHRSRRDHQPAWAFPWSQIDHLTIQSGFLVLEIKGKPARKKRIPTSQIPNVELLIQIVQQGVLE
jgi:hypothetical protein